MSSESIHDQRVNTLKNWHSNQSSNAAQNHAELVSVALDLVTRYAPASKDSKSRNESSKIAAKIHALTVDALNSHNAKRVAALKEWLEWLVLEMGDDTDAPTQMDLPVFSLMSKIESEAKRVMHFDNNPANLPKDWNGIDGRVVDERSGDTYRISSGAQFRRSQGAKLAGDPTDFGGAILGTVHMAGSKNTFDVEGGTLENRVGLVMDKGDTK